MLEIENGIVTELYVYSIDRFGKNARDILGTINLITSHGCNVIAEKEGLQMLIDERKINSKNGDWLLSTLADKALKNGKLLHVIVLCECFISKVNRVITF
jgi:DNA invertase Pin-like site-specific DNA recombinase